MSIIEILVIIVVVIVLATVGHNAFLSYVMRAKVVEAIKSLEEYQIVALGLRAKNDEIAPYYVLFTDGDTTGFVSGTPGGTSAVKDVNLKYLDSISAQTGTSGSDTYILLGAQLQTDGIITASNDKIYIIGLEDTNGVITWTCGQSTIGGDNMSTEYLPKTCINAIP